MKDINPVSQSIGRLEERTKNLESTIIRQHDALNHKIDQLLRESTKTAIGVKMAHGRIDALVGREGPIVSLKNTARDYKQTKGRALILMGLAAGSCGGLVSKVFEFLFAGVHEP